MQASLGIQNHNSIYNLPNHKTLQEIGKMKSHNKFAIEMKLHRMNPGGVEKQSTCAFFLFFGSLNQNSCKGIPRNNATSLCKPK